MASPASDIDQISDKDVRFENVRAMNATRWIIVIGMFVVFVVTLVGSMLGAFFGTWGRWVNCLPSWIRRLRVSSLFSAQSSRFT